MVTVRAPSTLKMEEPSTSTLRENAHLGRGSDDSALPSQGSGREADSWPQTWEGRPWQVLTAHDNGQMQVWDASLGALQPLLRIGQPTAPAR